MSWFEHYAIYLLTILFIFITGSDIKEYMDEQTTIIQHSCNPLDPAG